MVLARAGHTSQGSLGLGPGKGAEAHPGQCPQVSTLGMGVRPRCPSKQPGCSGRSVLSAGCCGLSPSSEKKLC